MRKLIIILFITGLWGCTQRDYIVQSDRAPDIEDIDFENYSTYSFSSHALSEDAQFVLRDIALKNTIREEISSDLQAKGFTLDPRNPDLLVNFRVFEEATTMPTYEEEAVYWQNDEVREMDRATVNLEKGSLIIHLVDAESNEVVWKGFASGILEQDKFDRDRQSIAVAVDMILDRYPYRGDDL